jgi:hypothetical protein
MPPGWEAQPEISAEIKDAHQPQSPMAFQRSLKGSQGLVFMTCRAQIGLFCPGVLNEHFWMDTLQM